MSRYQIRSHFISWADKWTCPTLGKQENNWLSNRAGVNEFSGAGALSVKLRGKLIWMESEKKKKTKNQTVSNVIIHSELHFWGVFCVTMGCHVWWRAHWLMCDSLIIFSGFPVWAHGQTDKSSICRMSLPPPPPTHTHTHTHTHTLPVALYLRSLINKYMNRPNKL